MGHASDDSGSQPSISQQAPQRKRHMSVAFRWWIVEGFVMVKLYDVYGNMTEAHRNAVV